MLAKYRHAHMFVFNQCQSWHGNHTTLDWLVPSKVMCIKIEIHPNQPVYNTSWFCKWDKKQHTNHFTLLVI
jgi:hypothetical protein